MQREQSCSGLFDLSVAKIRVNDFNEVASCQSLCPVSCCAIDFFFTSCLYCTVQLCLRHSPDVSQMMGKII